MERISEGRDKAPGRAIISLIENELHAIVGGTIGEEAVLAGRAAEELATRESHIAARGRDLEAAEERHH